MVPHLVTALTGPINELEQRILESTPVIERWFRLEWMEHTPPFYTSVDVRNAGFKLAPVDTNLYPGGWNHLTPEMLPLAVQAAMAAIEKICPEAKNLLLVPENHTRNMFYLMNVAQLQKIFYQAGLNVRLGSMNPEIIRRMVVFPQPDSPTSPRVSPARTSKSTPSTARTWPTTRCNAPARTGNVLARPRTSSSGAPTGALFADAVFAGALRSSLIALPPLPQCHRAQGRRGDIARCFQRHPHVQGDRDAARCMRQGSPLRAVHSDPQIGTRRWVR